MAPSKCSYLNCVNKSNTKNLFRFPINNRSRLNQWLENCGNRSLDHLPLHHLYNKYICIDHFDKKYVRHEGYKRKRLSPLAVPKPYQISPPDSPGSSSESLDLVYEENIGLRVRKPSQSYLLKRKNTEAKPPKLAASFKQKDPEAQSHTVDIDLPDITNDYYTQIPSPGSLLTSNKNSSTVRYQEVIEDSSQEFFDIQYAIQKYIDGRRSTHNKAYNSFTVKNIDQNNIYSKDSKRKKSGLKDSNENSALRTKKKHKNPLKTIDVNDGDSVQDCGGVQDSSSECEDDHSEINLCRICLQSFSKLLSLESYGLRTAYKQLTGVSVEHDDGLPRELCVECATLLDKYHKFRDKSIKGNQLLRQIYNKDGMTKNLPLEDIDQALSNLASTLDFSPEVISIDIKPTKLVLQKYPENDKEIIDKDSNNAAEDQDIACNAAGLDMSVDNEYDFDSHSSNASLFPTEEPFDFEQPFSIKEEDASEDETDPLNLQKKRDSQIPNSYSRTENEENKLLNIHFVIKKLSPDEQILFHSTKEMSEEYSNSLYQCQSCFEGFNNLDELTEHGLFHTLDHGSVVCDICKMRYSHQIELRAHTEEMHMYSFCCINCNQLLHTRKSAQEHMKKH